MMLRLKILFPTLFLSFPPILSFFAAGLSFFTAGAQKLNKIDKITLANLETNIRYLADPKLEGRRMGTPGDKAASDYIISELSKAGLRPKGETMAGYRILRSTRAGKSATIPGFPSMTNPSSRSRNISPSISALPVRYPVHRPSPCRRKEYPGSWM
jgi:hypothetical protein